MNRDSGRQAIAGRVDGGSLRVGIPRALVYYLHPGVWETFFRDIGCRVFVSAPTNPELLERASLISESEHCLPVKLFDAHVEALAGRTDVVFVPRILSTDADHISCPKLGALPDSIRADFDGQVQVVTVDVDERRQPLTASLEQLGAQLGIGEKRVRRATRKALEALDEADTSPPVHTAGADMRFLLLGHPYNLQTEYFVRPIAEKLAMMDVAVDSVDFSGEPTGDGPIKWDASSIMYDALRDLDPADWDGVIQLTSFNCGCDSMVSKMFENVVRERGIPFMSLILDEHTATAGVDTRLEAFVDSIRAAT